MVTIAWSATTDLAVADQSYNRITIYKNAATKGNGAAADLVLGEPNFTTMTVGVMANTVINGGNIAFDTSERLFVTNSLGAHRVLRFTRPTPTPTPTPILFVAPKAPTIAITGEKKIITHVARRSCKGTALATDGIVQLVQVKQGKALYRPAKGTTHWSYKAKLETGKTVFTVRALGSNGLSAIAKLTMIRR